MKTKPFKVVICSGIITGDADTNRAVIQQLAALTIMVPKLFPADLVVKTYSPLDRAGWGVTWAVQQSYYLRQVLSASALLMVPHWWCNRSAYEAYALAKQLGIPTYRLEDYRNEDLFPARTVMDGVHRWGITEQEAITLRQIAQIDDLGLWWKAMADYEIEKTVAKATEYGTRGGDLVAIGQEMAELGRMPTPHGIKPWQFHTELGIHFYTRGKIARAHEALHNRTVPSEDTLFDASIYPKMQLRARHRGFWG